MFYKPPTLLSLALFLFIPNFAIYAVVRWADWKLGETFASTLVQVFIGGTDIYIVINELAMQYREREDNRPAPAPQRTEWKAPIFVEGKQLVRANALTVQAVKFDPRRHFAFTIDRQLEQGFKVDLTETFWLKRYVDPKHPEMGKRPKRWKGTPEEFRTCKHDWLSIGIFALEDPTLEKSRYIVRNRGLLKQAANGSLPH